MKQDLRKVPKRLAFVGRSNVGKSYWSRILEEKYGYLRVAVDELIASELGMSEEELSAWLGQPTSEDYFERQNLYLHHEEHSVEKALAGFEPNQRVVLDTTGSFCFLSEPIKKKIEKEYKVVHLTNDSVSLKELVFQFERDPKPIVWQRHFRGSLAEDYGRLIEYKERQYKNMAHLTLDLSDIHHEQDFVLSLEAADIWPYERYLKKEVLPLLDRGRPNWDRAHTQQVVWYVKALIAHHPALHVDPHVMIITAYMHDYGYSELYRGNKALVSWQEMKQRHAQISERKWREISTREEFAFLSEEQKERIAYLVRVHDEVESLTDTDEVVFMEADTLGSVRLNASGEGFSGKELKAYIEKTKKKRVSKFITEYGTSEINYLLDRIKKRSSFWSRVFKKVY